MFSYPFFPHLVYYLFLSFLFIIIQTLHVGSTFMFTTDSFLCIQYVTFSLFSNATLPTFKTLYLPQHFPYSPYFPMHPHTRTRFSHSHRRLPASSLHSNPSHSRRISLFTSSVHRCLVAFASFSLPFRCTYCIVEPHFSVIALTLPTCSPVPVGFTAMP